MTLRLPLSLPRLVLLCAALLACVAAHAAAERPDLARAEAAIVERSNTFRRAEGAPALKADPKLSAAAREFAAFMARTDRYGHEADERTPVERAQAQGYDWCFVAENIAMQYHSNGFETERLAQSLVDGWIDSPGHRRNLLNRTATEIGVAIGHSARSDRYYAVQVFGRPAALKQRFEIANRSRHDVQYRLGEKTYALPSGMTRRHEQCDAEPLELRLPGQAQPARVQPEDGGRYRVEAWGERLRLVGG